MKRIYLLLFCFLLNGCSIYPVKISYQEFSDEILVKTDSWTGEKIAKVRGHSGGPLWSDCRSRAHYAMRDLIDKAKDQGGNAIGDVKWDVSLDSNPMCQKRWIFFLFPPLLLTPFFVDVGIEATAYKVTTHK